jgi:hypothetical protein
VSLVLNSKAIGRLACDSMLRVYLQSAQPVDKRMEIAEKITLVDKEDDGRGRNDKGMDRDVAKLDKFMGSVTDAALLREAQRLMGGKQSSLASRISSLLTKRLRARVVLLAHGGA